MELLARALALIGLGRDIAQEVVTMLAEQTTKKRINLSEVGDALDAEIAAGRELLATLRSRNEEEGG